jgi:hypothetical protein
MDHKPELNFQENDQRVHIAICLENNIPGVIAIPEMFAYFVVTIRYTLSGLLSSDEFIQFKIGNFLTHIHLPVSKPSKHGSFIIPCYILKLAHNLEITHCSPSDSSVKAIKIQCSATCENPRLTNTLPLIDPNLVLSSNISNEKDIQEISRLREEVRIKDGIIHELDQALNNHNRS